MRKQEIDFCLQKNVANQQFTRITILDEGYAYTAPLPAHVYVIHRSERPTFNDMFAACLPDQINVIANNDIWFDRTISRARFMVRNIDALCLTRVEPDGTLFMPKTGASQDVWIFRGIPRIGAVEATDFYMGVKGCDNRIAFEIYANGYIVTNPARIIHTHHKHESAERDFRKRKRLAGPFLYVRPVSWVGWILSRSLQILNRIVFRYIKIWRPTEASR